MTNRQIFSDPTALAQAAAEQTIAVLARAIIVRGQASWVIAGGSTPNLAYEIIVKQYVSMINWSKVTILLGDERIAPLDSPDSNWHQAAQRLLRYIPQAQLLRPKSDQTAELAADDYQTRLQNEQPGKRHFDVTWLGMGEDGHTLSLFPGHKDLLPTDELVLPIHDSPKPPADRISFSLCALSASQHCFVLIAGDSKANAVQSAFLNNLPIARAVQAVEAAGGSVTWLLDQAASTNNT